MSAPRESIDNPLDDEQRALLKAHLAEVVGHIQPSAGGDGVKRAGAGPRADEVMRGIGELGNEQLAASSLRAIAELLDDSPSGSDPLVSCAQLLRAAVERRAGDQRTGSDDDRAGMQAERGWDIRAFAHSTSAADQPPFSYTVGLSGRYAHPELVCVAVEHAIAEAILGELAAEVAAGRTIARDRDGSSRESSLGFELCAITAPPELLRAIIGLTGSDARPPALQILVKDQLGRVPGEHLQSMRASAQSAIRSTSWRSGWFRDRTRRPRWR
jgi:hypothetical protein